MDHVTTLPKNSKVLSDNHYSIQALSTSQFWGSQYHPEFNFKYTGQIMNARKKILLDEKLFSKNQIGDERARIFRAKKEKKSNARLQIEIIKTRNINNK